MNRFAATLSGLLSVYFFYFISWYVIKSVEFGPLDCLGICGPLLHILLFSLFCVHLRISFAPSLFEWINQSTTNKILTLYNLCKAWQCAFDFYFFRFLTWDLQSTRDLDCPGTGALSIVPMVAYCLEVLSGKGRSLDSILLDSFLVFKTWQMV